MRLVYTGDAAVDREILEDPVEYESQNVFIVPDEARWSTLRRHARADDIYHLADGGTAGYVMANGAMTTNQTAEKATRQALIEEGFVDCIVQLPDKLFPSTGIPC